MYTAMETYIYEPATPIMTSCMVAKSIMFTKKCVKKLMLCALYVHKSIHLKLEIYKCCHTSAVITESLYIVLPTQYNIVLALIHTHMQLTNYFLKAFVHIK